LKIKEAIPVEWIKSIEDKEKVNENLKVFFKNEKMFLLLIAL